MSIDLLNLSERAIGCLNKKNIYTIEQLVNVNLDKLNRICFMNQSIVNEIVEACKKRGIFLEDGVIDKDKFFKNELSEYDDGKDFTFKVELGDKEFSVFSAYYYEYGVDYSLGEDDDLELSSLLEDYSFIDYVHDQEGAKLSIPDDINNSLKEFLKENLPADAHKYFLTEYLKKKFKNLSSYSSDNKFSLYQYIEKFLEDNHSDFIQFVREYYRDIYESGTDIDINDCKKQMIRPILFVENEIRELKKSSPSSKKINVLENMLDELKKFPELCEEFINELLFDDYRIRYYIDEANNEKDIINVFINENSNEIFDEIIESCNITLDELFDLLPSEYLEDEFFSKLDDSQNNEDISFVSTFGRIARKVCKKEDGKKYTFEEISKFLTLRYKKKPIDLVNSFDSVYSDEIPFASGFSNDMDDIIGEINKKGSIKIK